VVATPHLEIDIEETACIGDATLKRHRRPENPACACCVPQAPASRVQSDVLSFGAKVVAWHGRPVP